MHIIVGGVVEKDGKILIVQEAKERCYGKWNLPAGHLECNETIKQAAIREIKEETGCDVELTGIVSIANKVLEDGIFLAIIFSAKLINENIDYNKNEILDVKWIDCNYILKNMDEELRDSNLIKPAVANYLENKINTIDIINEL